MSIHSGWCALVNVPETSLTEETSVRMTGFTMVVALMGEDWRRGVARVLETALIASGVRVLLPDFNVRAINSDLEVDRTCGLLFGSLRGQTRLSILELA